MSSSICGSIIKHLTPLFFPLLLYHHSKRPWCQLTPSASEAEIQWADYEDLDWDRVLEGEVRQDNDDIYNNKSPP